MLGIHAVVYMYLGMYSSMYGFEWLYLCLFDVYMAHTLFPFYLF